MGKRLLSDENNYFREFYELSENKEICLYSLKNIEGLSDRITDILSDQQKLFEVARNGQRFARSKLTWDVVARWIIEIL